MNINCALIDCKTEFHIIESRIKKSKSGLCFCSKNCKDIALKRAIDGDNNYIKLLPKHYGGIKPICKRELCENKVKGKGTFCSLKCSASHIREENIKKWLENPSHGTIACGAATFVRRYMLEQAKYKCSLCNWGEINSYTQKTPLDLDHIDGNHMNNDIKNLRILCPNCHSLTSNWKALNKDKVSESRYAYYRAKNWW